jgi:glycosyltransferase involved in cell wall biosynthesis
MGIKIAFAGRWGQPCGVSTYTEQLACALRDAGHDVVIFGPALCDERGDGPPRVIEGFPVEYAWRRGEIGMQFNRTLLPQLVSKYKPDVVHVQHEFGLWDEDEAFLAMLTALVPHVKVVVTLHTVFPYGGFEYKPGFFERLGRRADVLIVHTPEAHASLALAVRNSATKVCLVPHGTPTGSYGDPLQGRAYLRIDNDAPIVLAQGFIGPGKNLIGTIFGFAEALHRGWLPSKTQLVLAGRIDHGPFSERLSGALVATGYAPMIKIRNGFIPPDGMKHVMAAATCAVLNTTAWSLSASGAAHAHAAHGVPLAVARRPIYTEAIQAGAIPFEVNAKEHWRPDLSLVVAIAALCNSPSVRGAVGARIGRWAQETAWDKLVPSYEEIYGC